MGTLLELAAADGHRFAAYRADPPGKPRGGLVVIQEIFGVNSHIRGVADGYAADGYVAIAPALFDRVERGLDIGYSQPEIDRGRALMQKMAMDAALMDVAAAVAFLMWMSAAMINSRVPWRSVSIISAKAPRRLRARDPAIQPRGRGGAGGHPHAESWRPGTGCPTSPPTFTPR